MRERRYIEVFSEGCIVPDAAVVWLDALARPGTEIWFLDSREEKVARRMKELGVVTTPAIVLDGVLVATFPKDVGRRVG